MKKSELAYAISMIDVYNIHGICWTSFTKSELENELKRLQDENKGSI